LAQATTKVIDRGDSIMKKVDYNTVGAYWTMAFCSIIVIVMLWVAPWQVLAIGVALAFAGFGMPWVIMKTWNYFAEEDEEAPKE